MKLFYAGRDNNSTQAPGQLHNQSKKVITMKFKTLLFTIAAIATLPVLTQARPQGGEGKNGERGSVIKKLDTDGSGGISAEEAKGPLAKNFDRIDKDGNGEITKNELAKARKKMRKPKGANPENYFTKLDTDGNGGISKEEADGRMLEKFDTLDTDNSGEITMDELREAAEERKEKRKE